MSPLYGRLIRHVAEIDRSLCLHDSSHFVAGSSTHIAPRGDDVGQVRPQNPMQGECLHHGIIPLLRVCLETHKRYPIFDDWRTFRRGHSKSIVGEQTPSLPNRLVMLAKTANDRDGSNCHRVLAFEVHRPPQPFWRFSNASVLRVILSSRFWAASTPECVSSARRNCIGG